MKLRTKVLIPIVAILILSYAFTGFIKIRYARTAAENVMKLMDAKHISQAQTLAYMIAESPNILDFDESGVSCRLCDLTDVFNVDEIHV